MKDDAEDLMLTISLMLRKCYSGEVERGMGLYLINSVITFPTLPLGI